MRSTITMKKRVVEKDWLPLSRPRKAPEEVPTGEAFQPAWIDFDKGIRVGNLQPHERITRILKYRLEQAYDTDFVTDRWGRGVYWQWICWVPRANRAAKPLSHDINFGCAKLYISQERVKRLFQCGLAIERGVLSGTPSIPAILTKPDWDWHRLMKQCAPGTGVEKELRRLILREGFSASLLSSKGPTTFTKSNFTSATQIREAARKAPRDAWAGLDLFYPMTEQEVMAGSGYDLVQGIMGAFAEVVPLMNLCMHVPLAPRGTEER
jgi:hypothetical protein